MPILTSILPEKAPQTEQEALEICSQLDSLTQPAPSPRQIRSYQVRSTLTPRTLAPFFPCEGPPLPRFTQLDWPQEVQTNIRILKGKGVVKHMLARFLPVRIPKVDVYVLKAKMTGLYTGELDNIGEVLLAAGDMGNWLKVKAYELLNGIKSGSPSVDQGQKLEYQLSFEISGWDTVKELWDYMWSRSIDVAMQADIHVDGYETNEYTVDAYDQHFDVSATLPVDEMSWHAW